MSCRGSSREGRVRHGVDSSLSHNAEGEVNQVPAVRKSEISLNRVVLRNLFVAAGGLLLFLALLDTYLIQNYQMTIRTEWKNTVNRYASSVKSDLDTISSDLYDIYSYDSNFRMLQTSLGIESLPYAYELDDRLKTLILLKQRAVGYVFYYDELQHIRYFFSQGYFTNVEVEKLKDLCWDLSQSDKVIRSWFYRQVDKNAYAISIYRNNGISLCEIYSLEQILNEAEQDLKQSGADAFFRSGDTILGKTLPKTDVSESEPGKNDAVTHSVYQYRRPVMGGNLILCLHVPMQIWTYMNLQQLLILVIALLVVVLTVLSYFRIRRELFLPLNHLTEEMRRIGTGDWSKGIQSTSHFLEIQQVISTTDRMLDEIETQKMVAYEKTIQEQKARLQYLSLQLNPHFYLNGLKTLNILSMNGENEKIQSIIIRLSGYLRYLLQLEKDTVTLGEEIEFVDNYAGLYREMTERPIVIQWEVEEGQKNCQIPRLSIQTFVENSFKYAKIRDADHVLRIRISAARFSDGEKEYLEVIVRDNGEGYSESILDILNDARTEATASIGINNLKRRCEIIYGEILQAAFYNENGAVSDVFYPWVEEKPDGMLLSRQEH